MGLFDYFSKEAALERKRQGAHKRLTNMYVQSQDRMAAAAELATLAADGDQEAFRILMLRFNLLNPSQVIDQQEKEDTLSLLLGIGDQAQEWAKAWILKTSEGIHWPMRFLQHSLSDDDYRAFLAEAIAATEAGYSRDPKKKLVLVQLAGEYPNEEIRREVPKFLEDHDEQVRFHAVDVVERIQCPDAQVALCTRWASEEESSGRIYHAIAEIFAKNGWNVDVASLDVLRERAPQGVRIGDDGMVTR